MLTPTCRRAAICIQVQPLLHAAAVSAATSNSAAALSASDQLPAAQLATSPSHHTADLPDVTQASSSNYTATVPATGHTPAAPAADLHLSSCNIRQHLFMCNQQLTSPSTSATAGWRVQPAVVPFCHYHTLTRPALLGHLSSHRPYSSAVSTRSPKPPPIEDDTGGGDEYDESEDPLSAAIAAQLAEDASRSGRTPASIVKDLDAFIVGQPDAKRAVAVAVRNRWRRHKLPSPMREEVVPKNILMIGPTGCGKTEIARRLAKLVDAPFIKVRAWLGVCLSTLQTQG